MAEALSERTIEIVKSTVPALEAGGTAITYRMYQLMFRNAEVRALFNQSHHGETGSQSKALTAAVIAYARNIDNLGVLASRIERITQKHCGLNILPEHYHYVAESLLGAIKDVLGEVATEEVLAGRPVWYIHGAENGRVHAMGGHVRELAAQARNVTVRTFYNVPDVGDQAGRDYDERGPISGRWLAHHTPVEEAVYYLCGPRPFLRAMVGGLARTGVALNRILYEFFGPAEELLAA